MDDPNKTPASEIHPRDEGTETRDASDGPDAGRGKPGPFRRLLDWLIRGAERDRRDRGRCPA
jgi:hypothetical protein